MPFRSRIRILLADHNRARAEQDLPPISIAQLARELPMAETGLLKLINNKARRYDADSLERLLQFFGLTSLDQLIEYQPPKEPPR